MPAYRSSAEAEIREAVVARIREHRPEARIIHEINVSTYGPNRVDLIAVDRAEIIAVEIKSAKDKLDRLTAQIEAMKGVAHHVIAALHEKFLIEQVTNEYAAHYARDGQFYMRRLPDGVSLGRATAWVFPEVRRSISDRGHDHLCPWRSPGPTVDRPLPHAGLGLLWRDELYALCGALRVAANRRSTMDDMTSQLRWLCTGKELTRGVCTMLRQRQCVEADDPIIERIAA